MIEEQTFKIETKLLVHGAAATSSPNSLICLPQQDKNTVIYASHAIVNLAREINASDDDDDDGFDTSLYHVDQTIRTSTGPRSDRERLITAMTLVVPVPLVGSATQEHTIILACAFSDGTINIWRQQVQDDKYIWNEYVIVGEKYNEQTPPQTNSVPVASITDITGVYFFNQQEQSFTVHIVTATSDGVQGYIYHLSPTMNKLSSILNISNTPSSSVKIQKVRIHGQNHLLLGCGTALPRGNKVLFFTFDESSEWKFHGGVIGHLDWITSLDWLGGDYETNTTQSSSYSSSWMMLASGSQDCRIRLWKFYPPNPVRENSNEIDPAVKNAISHEIQNDDDDDDDDKEEKENDDDYLEEGEARMFIRFVNKEHKCDVKNFDVAITLEALLIGHEDMVTSVKWRPGWHVPCLLSSSMDKSILIWMEESNSEENEGETKENNNSVWVPVTRVGSAGGILGGSIASSLLGFINISWSADGCQIVGHGYGGSIHFWSLQQQQQQQNKNDSSTRSEIWRANPSITGHFRGVSDISWEATNGLYLLSAGLDQTCRLWSSFQIPNSSKEVIWREIGRPQVHGYDLTTVVSIGDGHSELKHRFVSGADEKEARAFDAPYSTLRLLNMLSGNAFKISEEKGRVERAYIPSLGLSNRASAADAMEEGENVNHIVNADQDQKNIIAEELKSFRSIMDILPRERDLGVTSLWPEVRKLFGHQTELVCLASTAGRCNVDSNHVLVASSCKAREMDQASIRLWNVDQSTSVDVLKNGHKSTVVTLSFSPDGKYLASSGKDRRICIWQKNTTTSEIAFDLVAVVESAHKRIIWSIDFCPFDSHFLASGSRDGYLKLWYVHEATSLDDGGVGGLQIKQICSWEPANKGNKKVEPVTAISFAPRFMPHTMDDGSICRLGILAVGMESGLIELWSVPLVSDRKKIDVSMLYSFSHESHIDVVKKLAWQPIDQDRNDGNNHELSLTLASCSVDHGVRIFQVNIYNIAHENNC